MIFTQGLLVFPRLVQRWQLNRKPYTVALIGIHSGSISPPLDFLRFKTYDEAEQWILAHNLLGSHSLGMTDYIVVDLRLAEQLDA